MLFALLTAIITGIAFLIVLGFSWIATCGIIKLITLCFGLTFSWPIATGIWLVLLILGELLS